LTERNCTIKLENWLKYYKQQFKHTITDKITSTNRINSQCKWFVTDADGREIYW